MIDIQRLLKKFDSEVKITHTTKENDIRETIDDLQTDSLIWTEDILPTTTYIRGKSEEDLANIEKISKIDISIIRAKKLVEMITAINILLIKEVTAKDLIEYDGNRISQSIKHIQNSNNGLLTWLSTEFEYKYLKRMLSHSLVKKNYNLINLLIKCLQTKSLNNRRIEKMLRYKELLDMQESGIYPFEWMLKDCEDSNINAESEIASMRFCKIVDKLNEMKEIKLSTDLKERYKQLVLGNIWRNLNKEVNLDIPECNEYNGLYLLL